MATLNHIVTQLADALNRPNDSMFKARLKELVIQEFSLFVARSIDKYGIDKEFVYSYTITQFTLVNSQNNKLSYLYTTNKIPRPLRYKGDAPFVYVGLEHGYLAFSYRNFNNRMNINLIPNVGNMPSYDFHNDRLRLWNAPIELVVPQFYYGEQVGPQENELATNATLLVQQVPGDPRESSTPDVSSDFAFDGDKEFPISQDLVQQIKLSLLKGELSVTDSKDVIEASHKDNN